MFHFEKSFECKGCLSAQKSLNELKCFVNLERCQSMIKCIEVCLKKRSLEEKALDKVEVYYESGLIL